MILNKNRIVVLFVLMLNVSYSQTIISGIVKDGELKVISNCNVVLKDPTNKLIITFTDSQENGTFKFNTNKFGKFFLVFSAFNYAPKTFEIEITPETKEIEKNAVLTPKSLELSEVIVIQERAITIKKDTITFLAKSFLQGNEQVVEDLLKKIPGLTIDQNGTIKVGSQEIEKVMVDGDDFFEKGYKLLTKNMPVNPIEKVELYQHYSNNKHLKGIENSNKVALNLTLKENFKRQWFGNMLLGYGLISENRYDAGSNLMNFGKKNKFYFITNLNNIGNNATGEINNIIRPYRMDGIEIIGDNQSANVLLDLSTFNPTLKQKRVNFNNSEMLSLNSIFTLSPKVKLKAMGFFNSDENDFFRNSFQSFLVGNTSFENTENFVGRKTQITGFGKIDLTYDISKTKTFEYTGKINKTNEKNKSDLVFNGDFIIENLKSDNQLIDQKLVWTNKFKSNKVLLISGRYINEKTPQNFTVNKFIYQDLFAQTANNILQTSENKMQFAGVEAYLLDRKANGNLFELRLGNQFRNDELLSHFKIKNNETIVSEPVSFQNNLSYTTTDLYLNTIYRFKYKKITMASQLDIHQLFNSLKTDEYLKTQNPFFINPKLGLEWEINKKNKILASYSINKSNATILDIYNGYIQTSFRSFSKGTGSFNQLNASTALVNYTFGNWGEKFFGNFSVLFLKDNDFFSTNTVLTQNYSQSEKVLFKNREFLTFFTNIERYFKPISSNLKITVDGSKSNYKNSVNNSDLREINNNSLNYGFEIRSGFKGLLNYHIGSKWNYNEIKTTNTNSYTNTMTLIDLSFVINDRLNFQIQTERYYFGNLDKDSNEYYFMDLEARYNTASGKLHFSLSGNNLFNTETFRSYSLSDISISKTEYRLQPRYVLLKMEFRF